MESYVKSREFSDECYLRNLSKNSKISLRSRRNIGKGMKILEILEEIDWNLKENSR